MNGHQKQHEPGGRGTARAGRREMVKAYSAPTVSSKRKDQSNVTAMRVTNPATERPPVVTVLRELEAPVSGHMEAKMEEDTSFECCRCHKTCDGYGRDLQTCPASIKGPAEYDYICLACDGATYSEAKP